MTWAMSKVIATAIPPGVLQLASICLLSPSVSFWSPANLNDLQLTKQMWPDPLYQQAPLCCVVGLGLNLLVHHGSVDALPNMLWIWSCFLLACFCLLWVLWAGLGFQVWRVRLSMPHQQWVQEDDGDLVEWHSKGWQGPRRAEVEEKDGWKELKPVPKAWSWNGLD